jgi:acyl carrier protein
MPTAKDGLEARLVALFQSRLHVDVPSPDTDLLETGTLDSLKFVDLLACLEEEFGVRVSLEDLELDSFRTISRIADFLAGATLRG